MRCALCDVRCVLYFTFSYEVVDFHLGITSVVLLCGVVVYYLCVVDGVVTVSG